MNAEPRSRAERRRDTEHRLTHDEHEPGLDPRELSTSTTSAEGDTR